MNTSEEILTFLRSEGWSVAVLNDYRLAGVAHTFVLLTHPNGTWIKGEGTSDRIAMEQALACLEERNRAAVVANDAADGDPADLVKAALREAAIIETLENRADYFARGKSHRTWEDAERSYRSSIRECLEAADRAGGFMETPLVAIDPDAWEPCSPEYLSRGGSCDAPRVWNAEECNHWHPKLPITSDDRAEGHPSR